MGAVQQAALARQPRHVPLRPRQGQDRVSGEEGRHGDTAGNYHEILPLVLYSVH